MGKDDDRTHFRARWAQMAREAIKKRHGTQRSFCAATGIGESSLSQALGPNQMSSAFDFEISRALDIPPPINTDDPMQIRMHLAMFELYLLNPAAWRSHLETVESIVASLRQDDPDKK